MEEVKKIREKIKRNKEGREGEESMAAVEEVGR